MCPPLRISLSLVESRDAILMSLTKEIVKSKARCFTLYPSDLISRHNFIIFVVGFLF